MYNREKILNTMKEIYEDSKSIAPYVLAAQPRRDKSETPAQKLDGVLGLHIDFSGYSHGFVDISGEVVDVARNYLMEAAIESGAKYLFFVGEDTVIPFDGFLKLLKTVEENPNSIAVGVYYIKLANAMIMVKENNWVNIPNVDPGQIIDTWMCGMDAMLIPIDILKKMKEEEPELPFCCIGNNISEDIQFIGEDNFFMHRAHKMGVKILCNTDVQCLHMDLASGKYTAHPEVNLKNYYTNIPIATPLTLEDKEYIDKRWTSRLPKGSNHIDKLKELINNNESIKFNIGCGRDQLEGYLGIDKYTDQADIKEDFLEANLPNNCAEEILASHVIEHIPQHRAPEFLSKCYNTLKENGKLVIETPDMEELCNAFINSSDEERFMLTLCMFGAAITNHTPETEKKGSESPHLWCFYPKILKDLLEKTGFNNIQILNPQGLHPGKNFRIEAIK